MADSMTDSQTGQNTRRRYEIAEDVLRRNIAEGLLPPVWFFSKGRSPIFSRPRAPGAARPAGA